MWKRQSWFRILETAVAEVIFLAGMLASACQQRGLDANAVMALCGNRNGSFGNGWDGIIALIAIAAIFG